MKRLIIVIAVFFVFSVTLLAQAKAELVLDIEKVRSGSCDPFFYLEHLLDRLKEHPDSTGLVLVFDGGQNERFGNLLAFKRNADKFVNGFLMVQPGKIKFEIAHGKSFFHQQYWVIPPNGEIPVFEDSKFDWNDSVGEIHFSNACLECEPSYPFLSSFQPNFEDFAKILKQHSEYVGLIRTTSRSDIFTIKNSLTNQLGLPRNRYKIIFQKQENDELELNSDFFLVRKEQI